MSIMPFFLTLALFGLGCDSTTEETGLETGQPIDSVVESSTDGWLSVSAGLEHTCGLIEASGGSNLVCFGDASVIVHEDPTQPPEGLFISLDSGGDYSCAVREDSQVRCWGDSSHGKASAPTTVSTAVATGFEHSCLIATDGALECWGGTGEYDITPPEGHYEQVVAGYGFSCALNLLGQVDCWGGDFHGESSPPEVEMLRISAGSTSSCGIEEDLSLNCWGATVGDTPPLGEYLDVAVGAEHACAIVKPTNSTEQQRHGEIACWGDNSAGQSSPPSGEFSQLSAGVAHTCAVRTDGHLVCWGSNAGGQIGVE